MGHYYASYALHEDGGFGEAQALFDPALSARSSRSIDNIDSRTKAYQRVVVAKAPDAALFAITAEC